MIDLGIGDILIVNDCKAEDWLRNFALSVCPSDVNLHVSNSVYDLTSHSI